MGIPPVSVLPLSHSLPSFISVCCRCESTAAITESLLAGSNAGPADALCPLHYKSSRHQPLPANESSLLCITPAFSHLWKPGFGTEKEMLENIRLFVGVNVFHYIFKSVSLYHWSKRGWALILPCYYFFSFIITGLLLVEYLCSFLYLKGSTFLRITVPSCTEKLGMRNELWG